MMIARFTKTSTLDWEGVQACVVYLAGCNFRCPFCFSKEDFAQTGDFYDEEEVLNTIQSSDWIEGVIVSGGEPLVNSDLHVFLKKLKGIGKKVKLETNGYDPDRLDDIIGAGLVDFVSMDVKAPLKADDYATATCAIVDPEDLERSIKIIMTSGIDYEFKTTVVPIHVTANDIELICSSIKGAKCYRLNQFKPGNCFDDTLNQINPYKIQTIREMETIAKRYVKKVKVSGV